MAPLRYVLNTVFDEALLSGGAGPDLFVNAVNVQTGRSRVFGPAERSTDALLASACAPLSYQAVQIDGESYWDGSYASNPSLWPLYEPDLDCDILLVELTPLNRAETPMSAKNIVNRINEVGSINGLLAEMRALDTVNRHVAGASVRMHVLSVSDRPAAVLAHEPSIKRTVSRVLFEMLRQDGRVACDTWLQQNRRLLRQTIFGGPRGPLPRSLFGHCGDAVRTDGTAINRHDAGYCRRKVGPRGRGNAVQASLT